MKRMLICAGLIVSLALPATTAAGIRHYKGRDLDGGTVSFAVKVRQGEIKKVVRFNWNDVPITCDQGNSVTGGNLSFPMPVGDQHRFHGRGTARNGSFVSHARVTGKFTRHGRRAHGTLRVRGDIDSDHTNCHTGLDEWRAHRRLIA